MKGEPRGGLGAALAATNWDDFDVPAIWSMIEDFDAGPQWRHLAGWEKACRLTDLHLTRMRTYRDELAAAWPPERNEASRVYLSEFDKLMSSVQATYEAAVANHGAMSTATSVLIEARDKLWPVYEEWQAKASTMASYDASVAAGSAGLPAPAPGPPPLPPTWREPLNAQAREVMGAASSEIAMAAYRLVTPPGYTAPRIGVREDADRPFTPKEPPFVAPLVNVVRPRPPSSLSAAGPEHPHHAASGNQSRRSQIGTTSSRPAPLHSRPITSVAGQRAFGVSSRTLIGTTPVQAERPANSYADRSTRGRDPSSPIVHNSPSPQRPLPGAVIGPSPVSKSNLLSSIQTGTPIGGVVAGRPVDGTGQTEAGYSRKAYTGSGGTADSFRTSDGHYVSIKGLAKQLPEERDVDPHDLWNASGAVASVIAPSRRLPNHDPGPAIGLNS